MYAYICIHIHTYDVCIRDIPLYRRAGMCTPASNEHGHEDCHSAPAFCCHDSGPASAAMLALSLGAFEERRVRHAELQALSSISLEKDPARGSSLLVTQGRRSEIGTGSLRIPKFASCTPGIASLQPLFDVQEKPISDTREDGGGLLVPGLGVPTASSCCPRHAS